MDDVRIVVEEHRTGMSPETLKRAVIDHLRFGLAKDLRTATLRDIYMALSLAARDRLVARWMKTQRAYATQGCKRVYYLSAEYLLGRQLGANLLNLDAMEIAREGLATYNIDLDDVLEQEPDPGLGNGGLGRLAACFLDSLATLELPATGYGIRYEFGIFRQEIADGWQVEHPDEWLRAGNPWEIERPEYTVEVPFGGRVEQWFDAEGRFRVQWVPSTSVLGVPFDTPVAGYGNNTVNNLRLWSARASMEFDLAVFNDGDYRRAVEQKAISESISKVLYPKDTSVEGKELRLKQQFFFVCCSIQDFLRRFERDNPDTPLSKLPDYVAIQLNDTHPAIAVAELMRVLVDDKGLHWDDAWGITQRTIAYTNHTLLPEALERWPVDMFERLLPRHLQIIFEINHRFVRSVHVARPGDLDRKDRMSIIEENGHGRSVRMAHLSVVGSHTVNGVAELHSRLLRERVLTDFADLWPDRFTNVTNGVTPRRWLLQCNPSLAAAVTERIGPDWITDLAKLQGLLPADTSLLTELASIKRDNKVKLSNVLQRHMGESVDPDTLFDVQVKRIHEYKRQLLCTLHVIHLYRKARLEEDTIVPRTVLFGGKAAPGYVEAKKHIKLIGDIASIVNADARLEGRLKVLFMPNYNVSLAQRIIPATDLSEQISMAGKEASGTGNMKFQMNGALTIGTLDGANIEIREEVGPDAFFLFGMDAAEVRARRAAGYDPEEAIEASPDLQAALQLLESGHFNPDEPGLHREIARYLRKNDPYLICADFDSYVAAQEGASAAWNDPSIWWPLTAINIACSGKFSSDRTIREYASRIWGITPVAIP